MNNSGSTDDRYYFFCLVPAAQLNVINSMKNNIVNFLLSPKTILYIFMINCLLSIILLFIFYEVPENIPLSYNQALMLSILNFLVYALFAYLALKKIKIFEWLIVILLFLTGVHSTLLGIFRIEFHQFIVKPIFIVFGIYYLIGSIILLRYYKKNKN